MLVHHFEIVAGSFPNYITKITVKASQTKLPFKNTMPLSLLPLSGRITNNQIIPKALPWAVKNFGLSARCYPQTLQWQRIGFTLLMLFRFHPWRWPWAVLKFSPANKEFEVFNINPLVAPAVKPVVAVAKDAAVTPNIPLKPTAAPKNCLSKRLKIT